MGQEVLVIAREAMRALARKPTTTSIIISARHLQQLRNILDDRRRAIMTSSSPTTSSRTPTLRGGVLPCARTPAPRSSWARRAASSGPRARFYGDEAALAEGARDSYLRKNPAYRSSRRSAVRGEGPQRRTCRRRSNLCGGPRRQRSQLQIPVHRQRRRRPTRRSCSRPRLDPTRERMLASSRRGADAGHRGVPALSPGDRDRRHLAELR